MLTKNQSGVRKMKRRSVIALILIFCMFFAAGETQSPLACDCGQEECVCFIQEGDRGLAVRGVILRLKEEGLLPKSHVVEDYDREVTLAVCAFQSDYGLPPTGTLDDVTLTLLLWGMTPDEMSLVYPQTNPDPVWVPTDGGKCRHRIPTCCGMYDPRKVSVRNAEALGLDPCGVCRPQ